MLSSKYLQNSYSYDDVGWYVLPLPQFHVPIMNSNPEYANYLA